MYVKEVMSSSPIYISPTTTLKDAAIKMRDYDFGFIPVGENDRLIGIVTDRDITIRSVADGLDPNTTCVKDTLSDKVLYCWEDDDIEKAAESMEKQQVHRLIVLDNNKRMIGVISLGDLARKTHDEELCGEVVEGISEKVANF